MDISYQRGIDNFYNQARKSWSLFAPPPSYNTSEWADNFIILSGDNAEPGPWRTSRAEYQRDMMDACDDPENTMVTFMTSAQIGKTSIENNHIGKRIHIAPDNIIMMHPTAEDGKDWMNFKFEPMVRECKELDKLVPKPRTRDKTSTQTRKEFPGGYLMVIGSNAARALRGRSAPIIICDEIDGFEVGKEGDQILLLWNRAKTYSNKILIRSSTPVFTETSRIFKAYKESDQREYYVPCPHCGKKHILKWENFKWDSEEIDGETVHHTETAHFVCPNCGGVIEDKHKYNMLLHGEWIAGKPFHGHAGFSIWEAYSPWVHFKEIADAFLMAKHTFAMQTFWNTVVGQPYDSERGDELIDPESLLHRREEYPDYFVPMAGGVITAGVDVQGDRLELQAVAHGKNGERWIVDYQIFYGDILLPTVWTLLDDYLLKTRWSHESGLELKIEACCIDSGFSQTEVLKFTQPRFNRRVYAVKGNDGESRPFVKTNPTLIGSKKAKQFQLGVDVGKTNIYSKLRITAPGPGYIHFNKSRDAEYFKQLTSERRLFKYTRGFKIAYWKLPNGMRNEALDTLNYAEAALEILNVNMDKLFERLHLRANEQSRPKQPVKDDTLSQQIIKKRKQAIRRPKKRGFVNNY